MAKKKNPAVPLTVSLLREHIGKPALIFRNLNELDEYKVPLSGGRFGTLYLRRSMVKTPRWLDWFEAKLDIAENSVFTAAPSAVLVIEVKGRHMLLTFGYGRSLLTPGCVEEKFGLRVALNSIGGDKLQVVDRQRLGALPRQTRDQVSRMGTVDAFGLDIEQDVIRSLSGQPVDESLGSRLTGADGLRVSARITLENLPEYLESVLEKSQSESYKANFGWIDHISDVRDPAMVDLLNTKLIERLQQREFDSMWMAVPEIIEWSDVSGFSYTERGPRHDDLHLVHFMGSLREGTILTIELMKRRPVSCVSLSSDQAIHKWAAFNCIYAEFDLEEQTYLLNDGKWYCVQPDFVATVNRAVGGIPEAEIEFPPFNDADEKAYNARLASELSADVALLDRKMISYGGGPSKFEFCDLYHKNGMMTHVKRYAGSQSLSHLFAQGANSAELFLTEPGFRKKVNRLLPLSYRLANPVDRPDPTKFEVAYAVISRTKKKLILPFFSRLTLRRAYQRLTGFGYRVSFTKIANESE